MRVVIRVGCLFLLLSLGGHLVAKPRSRRVLGVVVQTDRGKLDRADAEVGANVYSCDRLETEPSGVLRVKVGASQMFLSQTSLAALEDDDSKVQGIAMEGTVGFTSPAADRFSVRTPAGIVRAADGRTASGQIVFAGPQKLIISAIHGDLTLDTGGDLRSIPEGKSAEVTFDSGVDNTCHDGGYADQLRTKPVLRRPVGFYLFMGGAAAIPAYFGWRETSESESKTEK